MNKIKGSIYVLAFIGLFSLALCHEAEAETRFELGTSNVSGEWSGGHVLMIQERITPKYAIGFGHITEQNFNTCGRPGCEWTVQEQLFLGIERLVPYKKFTLSIGPYYFQTKNRVSSTKFNARLALEYQINYRWAVKLSHFSNAGSGPVIKLRADDGTLLKQRNNLGQDALLITYRFGK
jgi:hypothetical protein